MAQEFVRYQPKLPFETILFLGQEAKAWDWFPYPSRNYWESSKTGQVKELDHSDKIISLAENNGLSGYLDAVDLVVGCRFPCQTCIRDSQALSSTISLEAVKKLTENRAVMNLIPSWSICVGYASEPSDNPNILEIMNLMLQATTDKQDGFRISLKANYRQQKEETLVQLMVLANQNKQMGLTISLPLNRDNRIQDDFLRFKQEKADLFGDSILTFNLKNPQWQEIENLGRTLPEAKDAGLARVELFQSRGKGGLLINPEGLWFMVCTTPYEAHTPEIFTLVTAENAGIISRNLRRMNERTVDFGAAKANIQRAEQLGLQIFPPRIG